MKIGDDVKYGLYQNKVVQQLIKDVFTSWKKDETRSLFETLLRNQ